MSFYRNGSTVRIYFTTHDTTGALVAPSSAFTTSDIAIHKNGSAVEKTTTNGMTVTSPFDSKVGLHLLEIDTSNNTGDVGFWAEAASYAVVIAGAKTVASIAVAGTVIGEICLDTIDANVTQISGDSVAADNAEAFFDGTGYAGANNVIPTVTTLTNLPAITANWLTAAGIAADAVTEIQSGLSTLTQTQVTGGSYALNSASFAFHTGMDFTTTQKAATLARVTIVDTTTTNTDMRGTNSALTTLGATAPANWVDAAALASDAVTEIQSGLASQASVDDLPTSAELALRTLSFTDYATSPQVGAVQASVDAEAVKTANIQSRLPVALEGGSYMRSHIISLKTNCITADAIATDAVAAIQNGLATQTSVNNVLDGVAWLLADSTGAIAAPQSATATAVLTVFGSTYTVQYAGLTSTGVRTAPTLSKV